MTAGAMAAAMATAGALAVRARGNSIAATTDDRLDPFGGPEADLCVFQLAAHPCPIDYRDSLLGPRVMKTHLRGGRHDPHVGG